MTMTLKHTSKSIKTRLQKSAGMAQKDPCTIPLTIWTLKVKLIEIIHKTGLCNKDKTVMLLQIQHLKSAWCFFNIESLIMKLVR